MAEVLTDIRRNRKKSQRYTSLILLLAGLVLFASSLYTVSVYALSYLAGLNAIEEVSWEHTISGPAWSFQRETTTHTETEGMLVPIVDEGERVSKGLEIARLNYLGGTSLNEEGNRRIYSQMAGIVSFEPDGLELIREQKDYNALTIEAIEERIGPPSTPEKSGQGSIAGIIQDKLVKEGPNADPELTDTAADTAQTKSARSFPKEVAADSDIVKITDNLSDCYIYIRLPDREEAPFLPADLVVIKLEGGGEGKGTVLQCEGIAGGWGVLLKLESGLEVLRRSRMHQLELVLGTEYRAVAPIGSVVMKDGEIGIYVTERNRIRWKPVTVLEEKNGLQVIEGSEPGDIRPGDLIATRPWLIWDGMRLMGQ